jgi:hypothetical protein
MTYGTIAKVMGKTPAENSSVERIKAPWHLQGDGYVLPCKFSRAFVEAHAFVPPPLAGKFHGGMGVVMLIDYQHSDVGPYRELLFIPGRFRYRGKLCYSVTKIYVSTRASLVNGRENWGIPKQLAEFEFEKESGGIERVRVSQEGRVFARFSLRTSGWGLPVTSAPVPRAWYTLLQFHENRAFYTAPTLRARLKRARLLEADVEAAYFPDFTQGRSWGACQLVGFETTFPPARVEEPGVSDHEAQ